MPRDSRAAMMIATAARRPGIAARYSAGRTPTQATKPAASNGPATAPRLSPALSSPNALPCAEVGLSEASNASRAGDRKPRNNQAIARSAPTCHTVTAAPIAPVATAVPR